jgi:hypothetical protein
MSPVPKHALESGTVSKGRRLWADLRTADPVNLRTADPVNAPDGDECAPAR